MTLDEALAKTTLEFDNAVAEVLANSEDILRQRGASDEEIDIELARLRAESEETRRLALATVRAFWLTGVGLQ